MLFLKGQGVFQTNKLLKVMLLGYFVLVAVGMPNTYSGASEFCFLFCCYKGGRKKGILKYPAKSLDSVTTFVVSKQITLHFFT